MNYYEWWGEPEAVDVDFPEDDFEGWWMVEGRELPAWDSNLKAAYHGEVPISFHFGLADNGWPVFSREMRQFLEKAAPAMVQFLPFKLLVECVGKVVTGFCVGQVLRLLDSLDRERTKVRNNWQPINGWGDFGTLRPIVLKENVLADNKLFRIKGQCRSIVVRQDLKEAIERAGFTGQRFDLLRVS
jgi:hypothetical protein